MTKLRFDRPTTPEGLLPWANLFVDRLSSRISFGNATLTWPGGSVSSNVLAVNHELGVAPAIVLVTRQEASGQTLIVALAAFTYTSTQFSVRADTIDGQQPANTATTQFAWLALS